ncbi:MAG: AraC family transcriptional regulator ligand-binding domain-containing protein [Pseudomonadota bacterium]
MTDPVTIAKNSPEDLPTDEAHVPHYWVKGISETTLVDPETMDLALEKVGLSRKILSRKRGTIPQEAEVKLIETLGALTGDPYIGAELGMAHNPRFGSILVYLLFCSSTLRQALETLSHFVTLTRPDSLVDVVFEDREVEIILSSRNKRYVMALHYVEFAVASLIKTCRTATGEDRLFKEVHLSNSRKTGSNRLSEIFGCPVVLQAPHTSLSLHYWALDLPILSADDMLLAHLTSFGEVLMAQRNRVKADFSGKVKYTVLQQLGQAAPTLRKTAELLGVSERTLSRRLAETGNRFRDIADEARREAAETYLADPALSISEISFLLGYVDQASFGTAFRRWTGTSPGRFRQSLHD